TMSFGSSRLSSRAHAAPAKPPPTTMTRPAAPCAIAGRDTSAVEAAARPPLRKLRRLDGVRCIGASIRIRARAAEALRAEPIGDRPDLVLGETLGDAVHHRGGECAGTVSLHGRHAIGGGAAGQTRPRRLDVGGGPLAAGARPGA